MSFKWVWFSALVILTIKTAKSTDVSFKSVILLNSAKDKIAEISSSATLKAHLPDEALDSVILKGRIPVLFENSVTDISSVKELIFDDNQLERIYPGAFKNLKGVKNLTIQENNLTTISKNTFNNLPIEKLSIKYGKVKTIELGAFGYLPNLRNLSLYFNSLETLEEGVFDSLTSLQNLSLQYNRISELPGRIFSKLTNLKSVHFRRNNFRQIGKSVLESKSLEILDLSYNFITTISAFAFDKLPLLSEVNLHHNRITRIERHVFEGRNLNLVDLGSSQISFIEPEAFNNLVHLETLDLSSNKLSEIDARWFKNSSNIHHLRFDQNLIEEIPHEAFRNVDNDKRKRIHLSYNSIKKIASSAFKGLKFVELLDLQSSKIKNWNAELLSDVKSINVLDLEGNDINCPEGDFDQVFKANVTNLYNNLLTTVCMQYISEWKRQKSSKGHEVCIGVCKVKHNYYTFEEIIRE